MSYIRTRHIEIWVSWIGTADLHDKMLGIGQAIVAAIFYPEASE